MKQTELTKSNRCEELSPRETSPVNGGGSFGDFSLIGEMDAIGKIECCLAYMAAHIDQPMQVATLAALANVSLSHFFALFKQHTGCAPMDYFTRLRMRHACRLLGSGTVSVKEAAAALGYEDPFYFSRVFKSVNNVAPSKYRVARLDFTNELESRSLTVALRPEIPFPSEK